MRQQQSITVSDVLPQVVAVTRHACAPTWQDELAAFLTFTLEVTYRSQPGFISASILCSMDGTQVSSYEQWRSLTDYHTMQEVRRALPA